MTADELFEQIEFAVLAMSATGDRTRLDAAKNALRTALATTPQQPQAEPTIYSCNACDWKGTLSETCMLGSIGPLCPECRETTEMEPAQAAPVGEMTDEAAQVVVGKVEEMVGYASQAWDIVGPCDLARAFAAALSAKPVQQDAGVQTCDWSENDPWGAMPGTYESACGEMWSFTEGGVKENGVKFCHNCGKPVNVIKFPDEAAMLSTPPRICGSEPSSSGAGG